MTAAVVSDDTLVAILAAQQGRYAWGVRDCVSLAVAVACAYLPDHVERLQREGAAYHAMPEDRALAVTLEGAGGVYAAIVTALKGIAPDAIEACACDVGLVSYSDLLVPGTLVELPPGYGGQGRLGVVATDCRVWTWSKWRLQPINFDVHSYDTDTVRFLRWKT